MFSKIVESVLNEISAEDAYNKFYNVLPRENFDKLVSEYGGKFDNLMKAILNDIKSCIYPKECEEKFSKAYKFIKDYKSVSNEVRIRFNQNFKNGEYEDLYDMEQGLYELNVNGVDTLKTIQKLGLITLLDDDNFRITCTTTYESSHHFYGKSKWCTASDRLGQYDGWKYFISYIFDIECEIVDDVYYNLDKKQVVASLVQITNKKENKTFQMQLFGQDGMAGQICDFEDVSCSIDEIGLTEDLMDILQSSANDLVNRTQEAFYKEYKYQKSKDEYIEAKRERLKIKRRELIRRFEDEIQNDLEKKGKFIEEKFNELLESNLLTNPNFLQQLIRNSDIIRKKTYYNDEIMTEKEISEFENMLKQMKYAVVEDIVPSTNGLVVIKVRPSIGETYTIVYSGNLPTKAKKFVNENMWYDAVVRGCVGIIARTSNDSADFSDIEISEIIKAKNDTYNKVYTLYQTLIGIANYTNGSELMRYIVIEHVPPVGLGTCDVFDSETYKNVTVNGVINGSIVYDDCLVLMIKALGNPFIVLNKTTLEPIAALKQCMIDPHSYGWRLARNEKTKELLILCDKIIKLGEKFTDCKFSDILCDYNPNLGLFTIVPYGKEKEFSTIILDYNTGKIKYENANFVRKVSNDFTRYVYFARLKDGSQIELKHYDFV